MPVWLEVILEIVKITVPALIVYFTAYHLLSKFLESKYHQKSLELKQDSKKQTLPMRMNAYERLALLCERISIPNLVLRLRGSSKTAQDLRMAMLMTIQQEFEYNLTQQVYVSQKLWEIIKTARDNTVNLVEELAKQVPPDAPSRDLAALLLKHLQQHPDLSLETALAAIRKEAAVYL
ncbi:MAG: hypothetical protein Kow0027_21500 [Saprospiraceae bacterium]|jgi:hypothetical protein|nr:hypothetical protein [Saprospirales bacterium]